LVGDFEFQDAVGVGEFFRRYFVVAGDERGGEFAVGVFEGESPVYGVAVGFRGHGPFAEERFVVLGEYGDGCERDAYAEEEKGAKFVF